MLEKQYDARLILTSRGLRKLVLTDAGRILYQRAKYFCALEEATQYEISNCMKDVSDTLRISFSPSRALLFIHKFLKQFSQIYPDVSYELFKGSIEDQTRLLIINVTELGVANAPLCQLARFEVLYTRIEQLASLFRSVCKQSCVTPRVSTSKSAAILWAREQAGVAIVPMEEGERLDQALCCRKIEDERLIVYRTSSKQKPANCRPWRRSCLISMQRTADDGFGILPQSEARADCARLSPRTAYACLFRASSSRCKKRR